MQRLRTSTGLDINSLDVTTTSVTFNDNKAYANVAFHPKNDPTVNGGMTMKYTLEARNGNWVVVNVADSQGHGMAGHRAASGEGLPPGHPAIDSAMPDGGTGNPHATSGASAGDGKSQ